jgi:hypothetical protein
VVLDAVKRNKEPIDSLRVVTKALCYKPEGRGHETRCENEFLKFT